MNSIQSAEGELVLQVTETVAEHTGEHVLDLPPLFEAVDPEVLDFVGRRQRNTITRVEFDYAGLRLVLEGDQITVLGETPEPH